MERLTLEQTDIKTFRVAYTEGFKYVQDNNAICNNVNKIWDKQVAIVHRVGHV
jgi:hypothetical protein